MAATGCSASRPWPESFARRDAWWAAGDPRFDELDDALQALGDFAFRTPVPAYKHSMALALHLRGLVPGTWGGATSSAARWSAA